MIALFPGPAVFGTASDGKLGRAWGMSVCLHILKYEKYLQYAMIQRAF